MLDLFSGIGGFALAAETVWRNELDLVAFCETEPNIRRVANGVPSRVDRIKGLGNAIVPQVATVIMQKIKNSM
jgi:site-specific DNA-cytosine methylase